MQELPITFDAQDLVPVVIQDAGTSDVLMLGFMNPEALSRTRETGLVHFWSRSRGKLWKKGETSGNVLTVEEIFINCENNSLLIQAVPTGATCHTGYPTCYYRRLEADNTLQTIRDRWFDPADVYGEGNGIEDLTRRWWATYEELKSNDYGTQSGTSRVLRADEDEITPRIADELNELAGVLDGSHRHKDLASDIALEGGQVCYWLVLRCIRDGLGWADVRPDRALDQANDESASVNTLAAILRADAVNWTSVAASDIAARAHATFRLVAQACTSGAVSPRAVIASDLDNVSARLSSYQAR
jgi:phosphoribosyl-AMP cyclohydrolase